MNGNVILNPSGRKKSNFAMELLAFLLLFATIFGSIFCSWRYAALPVEAGSESLGIQINEFKYHPPVVDDVIGAVLNGGKGLNGTDGGSHAIDNMLNFGGFFGSPVASSAEPSHITDWLVPASGVQLRSQLNLPENVEFVLENEDDNTKYLYTTAVDMGGKNDPNVTIGEPIFPVYRTKIVKSGDKWIQEGPSEEGFAPSWFFVSGSALTGATQTPFFNWSQWKETKKKIQNDQGENPTGRSCYFAAIEDISPDGNGNVSPVYMVRQNKNNDNEWVNEAAPVKGWAPYIAENGFDHTSWHQGDPPA